MIIKPYRSKLTSLHDISSIKEKKRIIIIYKTKQKQNNDGYDIFISNSSFTVGENFYLPYGDKIHSVNSYSGVIYKPYLEDGSINRDALVHIINTHTSNRYQNNSIYKNDPIRVLNYSQTNQTKMENVLRIKKNYFSIDPPIPTYYNMEHQLLLAPDYIKEVNMFIELDKYMNYTLKDFIDENTNIVYITIDNHFKDITYSLNDDSFDDILLSIFANVYRLTLEFMIEQVMVIFDFDEESFNVKHIIPKFPKSLSFKSNNDGKLDLINFIENLDSLTNNVLEEMYLNFNDIYDKYSFVRKLFNMYIFISKSDCRVLIVNKNINNYNEKINKQREKNHLEDDILIYQYL